MVLWVMQKIGTVAFYIKTLGWVLAVQLLIQFPDNAKALDEGPGTWPLPPMWKTWMDRVLESWISSWGSLYLVQGKCGHGSFINWCPLGPRVTKSWEDWAGEVCVKGLKQKALKGAEPLQEDRCCCWNAECGQKTQAEAGGTGRDQLLQDQVRLGSRLRFFLRDLES